MLNMAGNIDLQDHPVSNFYSAELGSGNIAIVRTDHMFRH
jgi:hypothetical protein